MTASHFPVGLKKLPKAFRSEGVDKPTNKTACKWVRNLIASPIHGTPKLLNRWNRCFLPDNMSGRELSTIATARSQQAKQRERLK